jgi:hypothetical protein
LPGCDRWRLQLAERKVEASHIVAEFNIPAIALEAALSAAAATILAECDRRAWTGRDVDDLRRFANAGRY